MLINLTDPNVASHLIFSCVSTDLMFSAVEVRTLKSYYYEQLQREAIEKYDHILKSIQPNFEKLDRRVQEYINKSPIREMRQFVDFTHGNEFVTVYLNTDKIDDASWAEVISTLSQLPTMQGIVEFGPIFKFGQTRQLPKITTTSQGFI